MKRGSVHLSSITNLIGTVLAILGVLITARTFTFWGEVIGGALVFIGITKHI